MNLSLSNEIMRKLERRVTPVEEGGSFRSSGLKSTKIAYEMVLEEYQKAFGLDGNQRYVFWLQMFAPRPLFYAFKNIIPFSIESYVYTAGTIKGIVQTFLEIADKEGFSRDICSSIRAQLGAVASGEMPKPSGFVTTGQVCDGFKMLDLVRERMSVPNFIFDSPFYADEESKKYYIEETKRLITFIEEVTGDKLDYDQLERAVNNSKQMFNLYRELNELRKNVPAPMSARDGMRTYGYAVMFQCLDKTVEYMKSMVEEVKERVDKGIGYAKSERYRILWCQTAPFYVDLFKYLEEEFGAIVVFDELGQVWFDESVNSLDPFEFMAVTSSEPWNGLGENRIRSIVQHAIEYKADACIHLNQWGCRISGHMGTMVKDVLQKEVGIPTLLLDLDYIDSSDYNESQVKAKLKAFIETLG